MASSSSSSGRLPLQRALQNLRMECETGGQQRLQSQLNGKSIEELRKLCIAAGVSSHHHLILFHLNVLNHHISSLHFFSAHSSSVTSLFFPSICSLPPTCFRATLSSSLFVVVFMVVCL